MIKFNQLVTGTSEALKADGAISALFHYNATNIVIVLI